METDLGNGANNNQESDNDCDKNSVDQVVVLKDLITGRHDLT